MAASQQSKVVSISKSPNNDRIATPRSTAPQPSAPDSYAVTALADITDRSLHAATARFTGGMSPAAMAEAYLDWMTHLAYAPGKRLQLADKALRKGVRFANYAGRCATQPDQSERCIEPLPQDKRFATRAGSNRPTTSSSKVSCCNNNGGTTQRPASAACRSAMRKLSSLPLGRCSI